MRGFLRRLADPGTLRQDSYLKPFIPIFLLLLLWPASLASAIAADPSKDPILRIETGMHTGRIFRIGVDAENRFLVTGGDDKTVRVWELSTGTLLRTLRPPIRDRDEGIINGVAISPDGKTIACGGWTRDEQKKSYRIDLFDRETGKQVRIIPGLPGPVWHLTYSKNGLYLAAQLGGRSGHRVFRAADGQLVAEDKDYSDASHGSEFDKEGRLVTASFDGFIRLYDPNFARIAKVKPKGGKFPYAVSFSPDGSKIAVGFTDSTNVAVLSGKDLAHRYFPNITQMRSGGVNALAWSWDGKFLYAGKGGAPPNFIRKWTSAGQGLFTDISVGKYSYMHILSLKSGGIAFCQADPSFGVIDASDKEVLFKESPAADFRDSQHNFLISEDGAHIGFSYEAEGKGAARFSITDRSLASGLRLLFAKSLSAPKTSGFGMDIKGWNASFSPKVNGIPLKLSPREFSFALAINPRGETFLLGTSMGLHLFNKNGQEKWQVLPRIPAICVNISVDGKTATAAFVDGTIRWYRMEDGKELLAFFPHQDRKRWVLWTPSGYFDGSPGAEELIGWLVQQAEDGAADFYPASKFRAAYYRPDIIAKALETLDEKKSIQLANVESGRTVQEVSIQKILPPVVQIISPTTGTEISIPEVTVRFSVRSPSGEPVTHIKAMVDGRPATAQRGVQIVPKDRPATPQEQEIGEMKVPIPESDTQISIIAENKYAASDPATIRVKWRGKKEEFVIRPKLYILAVGISKYEVKNLALDFAAKDASDFAEALQKQKGELYRDVTIKLLANEKASKDEILDGLEWIQRETTSKDVAILFFAGHGVNDPGGLYYFLPVNANLERLKRTGVAFSDIKNTVASLAGKTVVFLDTCHSGNIMGKRRAAADITGIVNELTSAENGAVVFTSSTGNQYSIEDPAWQNGAFTKAAVEGINGKADYTGKGRITINMLDLYISERVKELTKGQQTPTTTKPQTIPDFPIAVRPK